MTSPARGTRRVLIARLDSVGDVLLAGPAVRAVAASGASVTVLCSQAGLPAARLLPGVAATIVFDAPWVLADPPPVRLEAVQQVLAQVMAGKFDEAIILTSFHQSPLPLALLLRMVGVPRICAVSVDYPGSLLDLRLSLPDELHEAQRSAEVAAAAGYPALDASLQLVADLPETTDLVGDEQRFVVVHPGSDAQARSIPVSLARETVARLVQDGWKVVVTGSPAEQPLTARVAGGLGADLGGRTSLAQLASILRRAAAVVVGNTGPAHLAAAVGTPVVSLWAPTVPAWRWQPYGVPCEVLGDPEAACAGSRTRICALPEHPCLAGVTGDDISRAVASLTSVMA